MALLKRSGVLESYEHELEPHEHPSPPLMTLTPTDNGCNGMAVLLPFVTVGGLADHSTTVIRHGSVAGSYDGFAEITVSGGITDMAAKPSPASSQ
ncbi:hypothetical protein VC83_02304 [Pseudogymnoascus destructans]|uniref:Uncharacterized protein n=2 Tax=Pseudogymnoascus destructans TaxID=655981 RepID=L8FTH0_PSED2|nr:uncharacterized protein VC83_02304 [Pseudogymnoascus destructans]ELR03011.1 hypothetical protein GMDG_08864 [Pseudogymnoascus destructans 20631-21]OAF61071.1 hypothetical protein VC83_02304 [Pseudogymnoascus destructans]